jgi:hypothetical protein
VVELLHLTYSAKVTAYPIEQDMQDRQDKLRNTMKHNPEYPVYPVFDAFAAFALRNILTGQAVTNHLKNVALSHCQRINPPAAPTKSAKTDCQPASAGFGRWGGK